MCLFRFLERAETLVLGCRPDSCGREKAVCRAAEPERAVVGCIDDVTIHAISSLQLQDIGPAGERDRIGARAAVAGEAAADVAAVDDGKVRPDDTCPTGSWGTRGAAANCCATCAAISARHISGIRESNPGPVNWTPTPPSPPLPP